MMSAIAICESANVQFQIRDSNQLSLQHSFWKYQVKQKNIPTLARAIQSSSARLYVVMGNRMPRRETELDRGTLMPELDDHLSAGSMNFIDDCLPAFALFFRVNAWDAKPTPRLVADECTLRDNEPGRGELDIVITHQIVRNTIGIRCTHSCERIHDDYGLECSLRCRRLLCLTARSARAFVAIFRDSPAFSSAVAACNSSLKMYRVFAHQCANTRIM